MVEAGAKRGAEDIMIKAILQAHESFKQIVAFKAASSGRSAKPKRISRITGRRGNRAGDVAEAEALLSEALKEKDQNAA
jgi:polyribonucleotide nucleotidyltransferase